MRYIVMAMESRKYIVDYLQANIPNLEIVWDTKRNATATWRDMLHCMGDGSAVVLEDDVVITTNFQEKVEKVIVEHSDELIQFHSRTTDDIFIGPRLRAGISFYNNQCLYYPAGMGKALLEYADSHPEIFKKDPTGYDRCTAFYMQNNKMKYWNHVPSLVDHLPVESLIDPRRSRFRVATTFIDPEMNAYPQGISYER